MSDAVPADFVDLAAWLREDPHPHRRSGLGRAITSGGGLDVGTRGGVVGGVVGRVVGSDRGVFGSCPGGSFGSDDASGGVVATGSGGRGGGCFAGRHAAVPWQSMHVVGKVSCSGNVLASCSGRWQVTQSLGVPFSTASAAGVPL